MALPDHYRRALMVEEAGLSIVEVFLRRLRIDHDRIRDPDANMFHGDFLCASGATVEVKTQPIDPVRYPQNFAEVCSYSRNRDDLDTVCMILGRDISAWPVHDARTDVPREATRPLGHAQVACQIRAIAGSEFTFYVHPVGAALYAYERDELLSHMRDATKLVRGPGRSHPNTLGCFVPLARMRWCDPHLTYDGEVPDAVGRLREVLGP